MVAVEVVVVVVVVAVLTLGCVIFIGTGPRRASVMTESDWIGQTVNANGHTLH